MAQRAYIKAATELISQRLEASGNNWLVKVFSDNAGLVRIDSLRLFAFKVETHNSPSALDPYGGALTGIVGNNRDPLGTGRGGARLLFNTDVLCFAHPEFSGEIFPGQLHPRRILTGVVKGIEDGGNKSGVPTINGAVVFDDRFRGKPLVYCGTGAVLPAFYAGKNSADKELAPGDLIIMAGGRVGRDGIHGATFSSLELDEKAPAAAVQIGSPITQKFLSDFLEDACRQGLIKSCTDNGAGGLSSSVGELADLCGGACVNLDAVPLKYPGLQPWEIFVSEAQERMTLVVEEFCLEKLSALAQHYEVEISNIGSFDRSGCLDVRWHGEVVGRLDLDFLHNGVPCKTLQATWTPPSPQLLAIPADLDPVETLVRMMGRPNVCSKEWIVRQYDHEVKGKTVLKPFMGPECEAPQNSGVIRFDLHSWEGVAVSNGIAPRYVDRDPYASSALAFDEAIRQLVAVGVALPDVAEKSNRFWSVNDNFCLPDSVYNSVSNPDGKEKLGKLVLMCQALYDMSTFFNIPMTSGKDSMKNDFRYQGVKISVPPTVLYSMAAKVDDVRTLVTSQFKQAGDIVFLVGETFDELGGSEFAGLLNQTGGAVPQVRRAEAFAVFQAMNTATARGLLASAHDLSDGGLAVAAAESAFGGMLGVQLNLAPEQSAWIQLYSESASRFLVSVKPQDVAAVRQIFNGIAAQIGVVLLEQKLMVIQGDRTILQVAMDRLKAAWRVGLGQDFAGRR